MDNDDEAATSTMSGRMNDQLNSAQTAFAVFYAFVWGNVANALTRWKAFAWGHLAAPDNEEPRAYFAGTWRRIWLSFLLLNALPVLVFGGVLVWLSDPAWSVERDWLTASGKLAAAATIAFTNFGFYRIWMAIVQYRWRSFYDDPAGNRQCPDTHDDNRQPPKQHDKRHDLGPDDLDTRWARPNLLAGIAYIAWSFAPAVGVQFGLFPSCIACLIGAVLVLLTGYGNRASGGRR